VGRTLAVDLGSRRVGLAVSDPTNTIASPLKTLRFRSDRLLIEEILAIVREMDVQTVVVGLPLLEDGREGQGCRRSRSFARRLQDRGLPAVLWDERFSSREAEQTLRKIGLNRRRAGGRIDAVAASYILADYLLALEAGGASPGLDRS
jgi:putative Holliday junction resolvase